MDFTSGYWPLFFVLSGPILAIVATLLGAVVNSLLTSRREKNKWELEDRVRHDSQRLQAYSDYLALVDRSARDFYEHWLMTSNSEEFEHPPEEVFDRLDEASTAFWRVSILGSPTVAKASLDCWSALMALAKDDTRDLKKLRDSESVFRLAARDELRFK